MRERIACGVIPCTANCSSLQLDLHTLPAQHFERIFQLFQTLKPKDEVDSTGIGLSLVKRIVERYGGEVRVQSTVGKGSQFFFTIPMDLRSITENTCER